MKKKRKHLIIFWDIYKIFINREKNRDKSIEEMNGTGQKLIQKKKKNLIKKLKINFGILWVL
jgi:hypothetical protein